MAGYVGYKPPAVIDPTANQDLAWEELMSMFPVEIVPKEKLLHG